MLIVLFPTELKLLKLQVYFYVLILYDNNLSI